MKCLLVEDDPSTATIVSQVLTAHRYLVHMTDNGRMALEMVEAFDYDLVLLDIMIPELNGIDLCRQLRTQGDQVPIMMLTAKDQHQDRVWGLEAGADDYMTKPFEPNELIARIRALLRRGRQMSSEVFVWDALRLNLYTGEVTYAGQPLRLTPREYGLLELFLSHPHRIFSRANLLDSVWPVGESPGETAVNTQIKGLRQKLKAAGMTAELIETIYGLGYRLIPPASQMEESQSPIVAEVMTEIAQAWSKFRLRVEALWGVFDQVSTQWSAGTIDPDLRQQAIDAAHRLVGSLGSFSLPAGSELARKLERSLESESRDDRGSMDQFAASLAALKSLVRAHTLPGVAAPVQPQAPRTISDFRTPNPYYLLVIGSDVSFTARLKAAALVRDTEVQVISDLSEAHRAIKRKIPDVILLDLDVLPVNSVALKFLAEVNIPVLILNGEMAFRDRLEIVQLGGQGFLSKPILPEQVFNAIASIRQPRSAETANILVVDDDLHLLKSVMLLLEPWGMKVTTLDQPQRFWQVLEDSAPDLLLLDVKMPDFSGLELCQVVRHNARWSKIPILFLSAYIDESRVRQMFTAGANDYVSKPIIDAELIARILTQLERSQPAKQPV